MKFEINKKFILLKADEKSTVNLYTLIDIESGDKFISIGTKEPGLMSRDLVDVIISIRTQNEKIETKNDGVKYVESLNTFVSKISKVKA